MIQIIATPPSQFLMILVFDSPIQKSDWDNILRGAGSSNYESLPFYPGKKEHFSKYKICFAVNFLKTKMSYSSLYSQDLVIVDEQ